MADKWTDHRNVLSRIHDDLFSPSEYQATVFNYPDPADGDYDPDTGTIDEGGRTQTAQIQVEYVPPGMDTTVDTDGTSFSWDTSIRFPQDRLAEGDITPLGPDNTRPTEIDLSDPNESSATTYEVHGYSVEQGSGMYLLRLVEQ